jgi:hypothetical protein
MRAVFVDMRSQTVSSTPSIFSSARDEWRKAAREAVCKAVNDKREKETPGKPDLKSSSTIREEAASRRAEIEKKNAEKREKLQAQAAIEQQKAASPGRKARSHLVPEYLRLTTEALGKKGRKPLVSVQSPLPE